VPCKYTVLCCFAVLCSHFSTVLFGSIGSRIGKEFDSEARMGGKVADEGPSPVGIFHPADVRLTRCRGSIPMAFAAFALCFGHAWNVAQLGTPVLGSVLEEEVGTVESQDLS
jgi:hypothetical protein